MIGRVVVVVELDVVVDGASVVVVVARVVAEVSAALGEHADAIRPYLESKPKGQFGRHQYSAEEWGFDPAKLREKMRPYTDYYGIELEA